MTVVDVEGAGFRVPRNDEEHEQSFWELDPFLDLGVFSHIQQSLHRLIRASADIVWCVPKINYRYDVHPSEHDSPPPLLGIVSLQVVTVPDNRIECPLTTPTRSRNTAASKRSALCRILSFVEWPS